jgi:hypothetical protein
MDIDHDDPVAALYLNGYLDAIFRKRPLLRREWDVEDLCQELSMSYIRKVPEEKRKALSDKHKEYLVKRMAVQLSKDKLRQMQRAKRDCRRSVQSESDFVMAEGSVLQGLCDQESWESLRRRIDDETWLVFCMRNNGFRWDRIARQMGRDNHNALRMRYCRNIKRLAILFQGGNGVSDDRTARGLVRPA